MSSPSLHNSAEQLSQTPRPSVLITAGPTHEPVDAVRYLGNRSSGTLGVALAAASQDHGCPTTLLIGPSNIQIQSELKPVTPGTGCGSASLADVQRFQTAADLERLLAARAPSCDVLVMAAAVADYRPANPYPGKMPRSGQPFSIELAPVPDLLAGITPKLRPGAIAIGFALEEGSTSQPRAEAKMARKGCHAIVLNPLQTMDSSTIDATILFADQREPCSPGPLSKAEFARRLIQIALDLWASRQGATP